jgi:uncharacterized protein with von Willebrand factor type A (vWA) domain
MLKRSVGGDRFEDFPRRHSQTMTLYGRFGGGQDGRSPFEDALADYRNIDIEEIMRRMEEVARHQKGPHSGGAHWIGTGGISPYGHDGRGLGGVRIGGEGRGKSARKVLGDPEYYPVMIDKVLTDDMVDVTLRR